MKILSISLHWRVPVAFPFILSRALSDSSSRLAFSSHGDRPNHQSMNQNPPSIASISLHFIFLLLTFFSPPVSSHKPDDHNYIVRFFDYRNAEVHRSYLEESLIFPTDTWRWIDRSNAAASFPTDFGLLEIGESHRTGVIAAIQGLDRIRDVHVDSTYKRELFEADQDGGSQFKFGSERRPGKLFTRISFEEEREEGGGKAVWSAYSNSSLSWKRKLMMQVRFSEKETLFPNGLQSTY